MAEECFIALTGLEEGFGEEKLVVGQEEQMLEGVFLKIMKPVFIRFYKLYFFGKMGTCTHLSSPHSHHPTQSTKIKTYWTPWTLLQLLRAITYSVTSAIFLVQTLNT